MDFLAPNGSDFSGFRDALDRSALPDSLFPKVALGAACMARRIGHSSIFTVIVFLAADFLDNHLSGALALNKIPEPASWLLLGGYSDGD
jgi:hypothetical protein